MASNHFQSQLKQHDVHGIGHRRDRSISAWSTINDELYLRSYYGKLDYDSDSLFLSSDNDTLGDGIDTPDWRERKLADLKKKVLLATLLQVRNDETNRQESAISSECEASLGSVTMSIPIDNNNQGLKRTETQSSVAEAPEREEIEVGHQENIQPQVTSNTEAAHGGHLSISENSAVE